MLPLGTEDEDHAGMEYTAHTPLFGNLAEWASREAVVGKDCSGSGPFPILTKPKFLIFSRLTELHLK